jgi:O-antigen ligase
MNAKRIGANLKSEWLEQVFAVLFGSLLGLALLKFVNPSVLEKLVSWPTNDYEWLINPWPVVIGYWLLAGVALLGIFAVRRAVSAPRWLVALPLVWLGWQLLAAMHTVDADLTRSTLKHFGACVVCYYLGLFVLTELRNPMIFLAPICGAFAVVIYIGFQQHFGGLEASRKYFFTYIYPHMTTVLPEYLKKIRSDRIFSTQFYPNALAGVVLLLLPATLTAIWQAKRRFTASARAFLVGVVGLAALACLFWSGSKGGWLLMLLLGLIALFRVQFAPKLKMALAGGLLVAGLLGFALKYAVFFERGAKSVGARFDYWQAAARTTASHPVFGTGPGTFGIAYEAIKRPESEMARLTHNDYLQQASDSGLVGFVAYIVFFAGTLVHCRPRSRSARDAGEWFNWSIWLGLLGWSLQSLLEFGLYVPALAWCGFAWMGWLLGRTAKRIDRPSSGV